MSECFPKVYESPAPEPFSILTDIEEIQASRESAAGERSGRAADF
ncbi:MAG TPA: hypothetical protein VF556_13740 [Pyrinomonadaceae bacterium]